MITHGISKVLECVVSHLLNQHSGICYLNSSDALAPIQAQPDDQCSTYNLWHQQSVLALAACTWRLNSDGKHKSCIITTMPTSDQCWLHGSCFCKVQYTASTALSAVIRSMACTTAVDRDMCVGARSRLASQTPAPYHTNCMHSVTVQQ